MENLITQGGMFFKMQNFFLFFLSKILKMQNVFFDESGFTQKKCSKFDCGHIFWPNWTPLKSSTPGNALFHTLSCIDNWHCISGDFRKIFKKNQKKLFFLSSQCYRFNLMYCKNFCIKRVEKNMQMLPYIVLTTGSRQRSLRKFMWRHE